METNRIIKKVSLVVAMAFILNGCGNSNISNLKPKEVKPIGLKVMGKQIKVRLNKLMDELSSLHAKYLDRKKELEVLNNDLKTIVSLEKYQKEYKNDITKNYNKSLQNCEKLSNDKHQDKCIKRARESYDISLKSHLALDSKLSKSKNKLLERKLELEAVMAIHQNSVGRVEREIKILNEQINIIQKGIEK